MIFQAFAVMSSMVAGNIGALPPVYWREETFVGKFGTVHEEVHEDDIESGEVDCIVVNTLQDGAPGEFYNQEVAPGKFKVMGKILFFPNEGPSVYLTEDQMIEIARLICFN